MYKDEDLESQQDVAALSSAPLAAKTSILSIF